MDQVAQDTLTDILCIYNIYDRIAVQISHNLQLEGDPCSSKFEMRDIISKITQIPQQTS